MAQIGQKQIRDDLSDESSSDESTSGSEASDDKEEIKAVVNPKKHKIDMEVDEKPDEALLNNGTNNNGDFPTNITPVIANKKKRKRKKSISEFLWPVEDVKKLLSRLKRCLPEDDKLTYKSRLEKIDWSAVIFKNYTASECKEEWGRVQKKVRAFRFLSEILDDANVWVDQNLTVKEAPKEPKRVKKTELKIERKPKLRIPSKSQTPFGLYYNEQLNLLANKDVDKNAFRKECKLQFDKFTDSQRLIWIENALKDEVRYENDLKTYQESNPTYATPSSRSTLTKEEKSLKERMEGKPTKPPNSAYSLYTQHMLRQELIKEIEPKNRLNYVANMWKQTPDSEKKVFQDKVGELSKKYQKEYASYVKTLPKADQEKINEKKQRSEKPRKKPVKPIAVDIDKLKANEPKKPPLSDVEYFASINKNLTNPKETWQAFTHEEKGVYKKELKKLKVEYIKDYEAFLKTLSQKEITAYAMMKKEQHQKEGGDDTADDGHSDSGADDDDESENSSSDSE